MERYARHNQMPLLTPHIARADLRLADARVLVTLCALRCVRDLTQIMEDNGEVVPARETIA